MQHKNPEIALVLYRDVQMAAVLGLTDLLQLADKIAREQHQMARVSLRISHWRNDNGHMHRVFDTGPLSDAEPSVVIVPPTLGTPASSGEAALYREWICEAHRNGASLGSICTGAFLLGETGLLDNRTITAHWTTEEALHARFPKIRLDLDRLVMEDGDIITGGGAMSWIDVGLKLADRLLGSTVMLQTARALLIDPPHREQRYYSGFAPHLTHGDAAILKVQHWLQAVDTRGVRLSLLAKQANLEERTFLRRFKKATGLTATEYVQRIRINKARELLQFSARNVDQIAWDAGYSDASAFRKVFTRIVGLTPAEFRRRFHVHT